VCAECNRRDILKGLAAISGAALVHPGRAESVSAPADISRVRIEITSVSEHALRISLLPKDEKSSSHLIPSNGSLMRESWGVPIAQLVEGPRREIAAGKFRLTISWQPLTIAVANQDGVAIQRFEWNEDSGVLSFLSGATPIYGLGEGGPQFDRRGSTDPMHNGQGGYKLHTHGSRVPIPWIIGTAGWAIFFNQPFGTFDFTQDQSHFVPVNRDSALPLDLFLVASTDPATIMSEYAGLTGLPELPPRWSLGYLQSHRTLASREEVIAEAKTFREKNLPCDAMIYLGTGFCPSGWNTENGSFAWNDRVFPDPKEVLHELHQQHFRAAVHVVILSDKLRGTVHDACDVTRFDEAEASCYWDMHRKDFAMGIDGWWPDEGDPLDIASRLVRNRMYWDGPQIDRPNERPFALHRNGYAGLQRYASFLWSGDVYSTWETLKTHIPVALNTALSGIPYWGTDIGGFVPTPEFTAELYIRWFQFGAFCPLFRCHGRAWKLRLPWGWGTGDPGPTEINNYSGADIPDPSQLHDTRVEPICRKYLELRYRMLPYLYSTMREGTKTGMPIMRPLWLHFSNDSRSVECGDEYLWGKSMLVAPVVEKGATERRVYLPPSTWYDYWNGERLDGGREITRPADLETLPLYVRAGSILPLGPVKQYADERVDDPVTIFIYPGADASFLLYEDDGISFDYCRGEWTGIEMTWNDKPQTLTLKLAPGSRMLSAQTFNVQCLGQAKSMIFSGKAVSVSFQ
jgi:alpha-glucosidase (family GH31 glycosyl hydrolase)